ncbi:MAG: Glycosyltransferase WecB/TagA/CpsF family [Parcubacteria group bacterium GW2011_GWD2_38_12]|nr:MAG: Glycosyltransferase WecB/TagA/CpsF family [Parcubacteria group bacterium GW2011_GWC2_36_17]KKQ42378.1 MAG: Glycosyltransferase WecB/TagA/CpsF family [Parcubacteria group bacterium GW2011_GWE2_37_8]KKQ52896.1 MAG: Glycosyltransferase WecB/TagA/CpsF family [Parcubacteria group bacterium GW2011_GWD2_38_12]KKQ59099.1 MAG: Glycosyltransferase WecB/TagA/CpsF family [Parcubacteria group bacterium GW2011_GWC1_38_17]KKQ59714.1 MAG: Glycosyltransferase WecB/TagA/CpsF family [Parcubacteria group b
MKIEILGVKIDNITFQDAIEKARALLGDDKQNLMVTCNPEILLHADKDNFFRDILNSASICVADGFGLILASKFLKDSLMERVVGVDFVGDFCKICEKESKSVYLLGGRDGIAQKTADRLKKRFPDLKISGWLDGGINLKDCCKLIKSASPDVLFVALGAPRQEKWIYDNLREIPSVKLAIGVGGAFDFISGNVKRAPKFMRRLGLEWLWRLIIQPWRIRRIFNAVIVFPILFFASIIKK